MFKFMNFPLAMTRWWWRLIFLQCMKLIPRLHDTTGCTTGLTTACIV